MDMKILHCTVSDAHAWDEFLEETPGASFYHLFAWKEINESCFGHRCYYLAAVARDRIVGVFPLVYIKSRLFGKILCSMPFVNFGGPCALDTDAEQALLREADAIVQHHKADYLEIRGTRRTAWDLPTSEHKVSMTIDLAQDPDVLWKGLDKRQRKEIRHADKVDLQVVGGGAEYLDVFYDIMSESWKNLGTPFYDKVYFRAIVSAFRDSVRIFVVQHGNVALSAAFNGFYKKTVDGMWLGNRSGAKGLHTGYALYWEMIKYACEHGFEKFHLGRSSVHSGGELFKKKWNAYPTQLYWQYILGRAKDIPQLNVENPKYRLAIAAWKASPVSITRLLGPVLSRNIP